MKKKRHTTIRPKVTPKQRTARRGNAQRATEERKRLAAERHAAAAAEVAEANVPPIGVSEARLMAAKAKIAELERAEREGDLAPVAELREEMQARYAGVRTRILGVPSRVKQRMPELGIDVINLVDDLLREALEDLADNGGAEGAEE